MSRSTTDALRSVKRHVALALGDDWEVRLSEEDGTFQRPGALVQTASPMQSQDGSPSNLADLIQAFAIYVYPPLGESAAESLMNAQVAEDALLDAFRFGWREGVQIGAARPMRVPLYRYDGLKLAEPSDERHPSDFMRVSDLSVGHSQDPNDRMLWTVTCEVRMSWRRSISVPFTETVDTVTAQPTP